MKLKKLITEAFTDTIYAGDILQVKVWNRYKGIGGISQRNRIGYAVVMNLSPKSEIEKNYTFRVYGWYQPAHSWNTSGLTWKSFMENNFQSKDVIQKVELKDLPKEIQSQAKKMSQSAKTPPNQSTIKTESDNEDFEQQEDDCFIVDVVRGGYDVSCGGKFIKHVEDYDDAIEAVKNWQEKNKWYPNTWFIDDHGGHGLVNLHDKLAYEGSENIRLKNLIPELNGDVSPIDGMRKQQAVKYIQKNFKVYEKLRGFFSDESWQPINGIIGELQKGGIPIEINKTEYYKDTNGNPAGKIWQCEIPFINQNNRPDKIYVRITAAGAGSVSDPLSRYDVTFVIN